MFSTVHGTVGALSAKYTNNLFLGFFLSIFLHFVFDAIPHGDEKLVGNPLAPTKKEIRFVTVIATLDFIIMTLILSAMAYLGRLPADLVIAVGVFGGLLPDLTNAAYIILKIKFLKPLLILHERVHKLIKYEMTLTQGLIFQIFVETILLVILFAW